MQPQQPQGQWQYDPGDTQAHVGGVDAPVASATQDSYSWTASEFVAYQKASGWYVQVILIVTALAVAAYFLTRDLISTVSIIIVGIVFVAFAARKPRVLTYAIDKSGVHVADKVYKFTTLRSFAVIDEGTLHSITLLPAQRFMPSISMYFDPQDEAHIIELLGSYLPKEERKQDSIDRLMHRIRF